MTITVRFTGICTHLPSLGENQPSAHRVVLVRAEHGAYLNEAKIPPHIPTLKIKPADVLGIDRYPHGLEPTGQAGVWRLCGVGLTLEGCTGPLSPQESWKDIPHLEAEDEELPAISTQVATKEQAACYFDIRNGKLSSEKMEPGGAIVAVLETETSEAPTLRVTCFWNREQCFIRLRQGATIEIEHAGYPDGDTDQDFLLHYRVFGWVPASAKVPPKPKSPNYQIPGGLSLGCSNSQYP